MHDGKVRRLLCILPSIPGVLIIFSNKRLLAGDELEVVVRGKISEMLCHQCRTFPARMSPKLCRILDNS